MPMLPTKLKHDAILESIFELRFDPNNPLIEVVIGKLADATKWPGRKATRLPWADMPAIVRMSDENLRYQPLFDFTSEDGITSIKIGTHSIACHVLKSYCGWTQFSELLKTVINQLFETIPGVEIRRIGLRYLNAFVAELHEITSVSELRMAVSVGGIALNAEYNLNFRTHANAETECLVRVATPEFVTGVMPPNAHTFIDVDVSTPISFRTKNKESVEAWIEQAHNIEKTAFFSLLSDEQIARMVEE